MQELPTARKRLLFRLCPANGATRSTRLRLPSPGPSLEIVAFRTSSDTMHADERHPNNGIAGRRDGGTVVRGSGGRKDLQPSDYPYGNRSGQHPVFLSHAQPAAFAYRP